MRGSIRTFTGELGRILADQRPSVYLFGSVVLGDFRLGWSDIDLICLCEREIGGDQAAELVNLRQALLARDAGNPYYRSFEGGVISWDALINRRCERAVYWGTSGQRIADRFELDPFSTRELKESGELLCGPDGRDRLSDPTRAELAGAVARWYGVIREYAQQTDPSIESAGWLLDIARGLYTLETGAVIAKTEAGKWALRRGLAPEPDVLRTALEIRERPLIAKRSGAVLDWCAQLGPSVQRFADVLEEALRAQRLPLDE